jgi:hypothetical protein
MAERNSLPALHPDDLITIVRSVAWTRTGDETLIHDMITQELYRLNDVGTRVWELIHDGSTVDEVIRIITAEYNLPPDVLPYQVRDDITAVLMELSRRRLVQINA